MSSENKPLPWFYIGQALTEERKNLYANNRHNLVSQALGKPDTLSVWYSREHIVKLLEEIDHAGGDGLRVYFGMYESTHPFAGQTCLLMNVTRAAERNGQLVHDKVILENEQDFVSRSSLERDFNFDANERDFNFGSPCPPICDEEN